MMLEEENEFLEETREIKSQENVRPTSPIPTPIIPPQLVDDHRWSKDVTMFFMYIIVERIVDVGWQAF